MTHSAPCPEHVLFLSVQISMLCLLLCRPSDRGAYRDSHRVLDELSVLAGARHRSSRRDRPGHSAHQVRASTFTLAPCCSPNMLLQTDTLLY